MRRLPAHSYNRALVAASIGSYGAYLADGSEYRYYRVLCYHLKWFNKFRLHMQVVGMHGATNTSLLCMSYCISRSQTCVLCTNSGDYGPYVNVEKLKDFHRRRLQILVEAGADMLAFETIPNKLEAQVYMLFYPSHMHRVSVSLK